MTTLATSIARRTTELFADYQRDIHVRTDRLFAGLMAFQWLVGIGFALWVSPLTWEGAVSRPHLHVWAAIILGGIISVFPALLGWFRPGVPSTRYIIGVAQMLMGALLIHLTGGRIETHFHVFGSLAFLAFYRDWRVLIPATVVVALDHFLRGMFWPQSVYGVVVASQWRWVEHAAWVVFEDLFLVVACVRSVGEMRQRAERTAALEHEVRTRQEAETEARNANARDDAILEVALDCVVLVDEAGRIVQFNPAAEATFGYSSSEAVGRNVADVMVPAGKRDAYRAAFNHYFAAGDATTMNRRVELTGVRKNGQEFPVEIAVARISTVGAPLFAGYLRDITEQKHAQEELARQTRDLQDAHDTERHNAAQLASLVEELRITQRQAEAATNAKSEFLASMSHELRTPLNAIILYSELLQEEARDGAGNDSIPDLQRIQFAGKHLLELINGILDLSKIEAGKMTLEPERFDVRAMIGGLADSVASLIQKNNNVLHVNCGDIGQMRADLTKTRQILLNLLSNASKFTTLGTITVDVERRTIAGEEMIEFRVTDTGVGMSDEQRRVVFEPFTQADVTTTRKYGGTGLGLAIVARFCDLMRGTIAVDSIPGKGSCFVVQLPVEMVDAGSGVTMAAGAA